jgi:hypothetical protein
MKNQSSIDLLVTPKTTACAPADSAPSIIKGGEMMPLKEPGAL